MSWRGRAVRCAPFTRFNGPNPASYIGLNGSRGTRITAMVPRSRLSQVSKLPGSSALLAGCKILRKPDFVEMQLLDQPPAVVCIKLDRFCLRVRTWYAAVEAWYLLPVARPLTPNERGHARRLSALQPQGIRVVVLDAFSAPKDVDLRDEAAPATRGW